MAGPDCPADYLVRGAGGAATFRHGFSEGPYRGRLTQWLRLGFRGVGESGARNAASACRM
jgi:hypothetical protein